MKEMLKPGLSAVLSFRIPVSKTVPHLYPEAPEFQVMPRVFATGYLVGLIEWTCMRAVNPHLLWPAEQTVGTDVRLTRSAATPPGLVVTVRATLEKVDGGRLLFSVEAHDGVDEITRGTHERFVIETERFNAKVARKVA
jgi:fluoroacetyl-CoA thioesterase